MTIERANEIVDGIERVLASQDYVGDSLFVRLSSTGASTRWECLEALYIVTAQFFQKVFGADPAPPGGEEAFNTFARGASSAGVEVVHHFVPDRELNLIAALLGPTNPRVRAEAKRHPSEPLNIELLKEQQKYCKEHSRLDALALSDGLMNTEAVDSFVRYLRTLDPNSEDYWTRVYERIAPSACGRVAS